MKKVININFQGQVIAIEETAYELLKQYINSLKTYFSREEGGDEIVNDIECRIAELFGNRLKHGINCITDEDVKAIVDSIGKPQDFDSDYDESGSSKQEQRNDHSNTFKSEEAKVETDAPSSLNRNTNDSIIGGVCSGLAHYFKTDPVWIRLLFVVFFGVLFWLYIVLWVVLKPKGLQSNVSKRLYRNPSDRFIGGVCGGIAAFFRIDSWIPRMLFLLPLLLNMIGMVSFFPLNRIFHDVEFNWNFNMGMVVVYFVLWAIIPLAKTVKQKLEMMGEEDYIRSIREKVTDNVASTKNRIVNEENTRVAEESKEAFYAANNSGTGDDVADKNTVMDAMPPVPPASAHGNEMISRSERSGCLHALGVMLKIVFFSFVGFFLLIMVAIFMGLLITGTHLSSLKSLFIDPGFETNMLYLSMGLIFLLPVVSVIIWIIRRAMKAKSRPVIGIAAAVIWIIGLTMTGLLGTQIANKFKVESSSERTVPIVPFNSDKLYVEMMPFAEDYAEFKTSYGPGTDFDELPYTTINEDTLLFDNINLQIGKSSDSLFHVRVISATLGKDLRMAKSYISQFSYEIIQQDSLLLIPEFLSVPVEQGFRNQSITVEISVPAGKTIELSEELRDYKDNRPPAVVRKRIKNTSLNTEFLPVEDSEKGNIVLTISTDAL